MKELQMNPLELAENAIGVITVISEPCYLYYELKTSDDFYIKAILNNISAVMDTTIPFHNLYADLLKKLPIEDKISLMSEYDKLYMVLNCIIARHSLSLLEYFKIDNKYYMDYDKKSSTFIIKERE